MRSDDVSRMSSGRWVRRGREIILLGDPGAPAGALEEETGIPGSVIHPAIDVHAQYALTRMLKPGSDAGAEARAMLQAVSKGTLAGIYKVDQQVPALRAKAMGVGWWQLIPAGQGAAVVPDPAGEGAPIIAFASSLVSRFPELERVLRRAWDVALRVYARIPPARLRLSAWSSNELATEANLRGGRGLIDDVSLLRTLANLPDGEELTLGLDPRGRTSARGYMRIAAACHDLGIQALAGFSIVPEGEDAPREQRIADRFNRWLLDPERQPGLEAYARQMAARAAELGFDGISVDVETLKTGAGKAFTEFCQLLADALKERSMWLAVAVTPKTQETGLWAFSRELDFGMARNHPNLVIRPMGYAKEGPLSEDRHREILNHAQQKHGVPADQIQMGLQNTPPTSRSRLSHGEIVSRCRNLLRRRRVGLVMFYLRHGENWDEWADYDRALNRWHTPAAARPGTKGEPLQAPLDPTARARLNPSAGTSVANARVARPRPLVARR